MLYKKKFTTICNAHNVMDSGRAVYAGHVYPNINLCQLNFFAPDKKTFKSIGLANAVAHYLWVFYFKFISNSSENNDEFQWLNEWMVVFSILGNFIISCRMHDDVAWAVGQGRES